MTKVNLSNKDLEKAPPPKFSFSQDEFLANLQKLVPLMNATRIEIDNFLALNQEVQEHISIPNMNDMKREFDKICSVPHRRVGTKEAHQIEDYIENMFNKFGLVKVTKEPMELTNWVANKWNLTLKVNKNILNIPSFYVLNTGFTPASGVTAPLIYLGNGSEKDYDGKDIKGKIVVIDIAMPLMPIGLLKKQGLSYYFSDPINAISADKTLRLVFNMTNFHDQPHGTPIKKDTLYWRAYEGGALGLILILRDFPANLNTQWGPYDGVMKPIPALYVSKDEGKTLHKLMQSGPVEATIILEGDKEPTIAHNIMGILPGTSDETLMISTHHDSPFKGASEDGTGLTILLSQLRTWSKVPIEKRKRTLLFVATAGHHYAGIGAVTFAKTHKLDVLKDVLVNLNLEHLCAKEVEEDPETHNFRFTGQLALGAIFVSRSQSLINYTVKALVDNKIENLVVIPDNYFGTLPIGEAGHFAYYCGFNVIHWIRLPYYLLTAEDTVDKIDFTKFPSTVQCITDLVNSLMKIKKEDM